MRIVTAVFTVLALFAGAATADDNPDTGGTGLIARLSYFSTDDGLASNFVFSINEDHDGFLWLGTAEGVSRFDGKSFSVPPLRNAQTATVVNALTVPSTLALEDGSMWAGTWGGGVLRYDPLTLETRTFRHQADNVSSLTDDYVDSLARLPDGRVLAGTLRGAAVIDPVAGSAKRVTREDAPGEAGFNHVRELHVDTEGTTWIATREGLFVLDPESVVAAPVQAAQGSEEPAILRQNILSLAEDGDGLILGSERGLWRLDGQRVLSRYVPPGMDDHALAAETITALGTTRAGNLMIGTFSQGAFLEERSRSRTRAFSPATPYPYGISDATIVAVFESRDGTVWFGTQSAGFVGVSPLSLALEHHAGSGDSHGFLGGQDVTSVAVTASGNALLGTNHGLAMLSLEDPSFTADLVDAGWRVPAINAPVTSLDRERDGAFWAIASAGNELFRVNEANRTVHRSLGPDSGPPQGHLAGIRPSGDGDYWLIIYPYSLVRFDPVEKTLKALSVINPLDQSPLKLHAFVHGRNGRFLVDTDKGPVELDGDGRFLRWFTGSPRDGVNSTFIEDDGSYWLATADGAFHVHANGEAIEHVTMAEGLPGNNVARMDRGPDGTYVFLTGKGISFRRAPGQPLISLRGRHGLQSDVTLGLAFLDDGRALAGGPNGVSVVDFPRVLRALGYSAPLKISAIELISSDGASSLLPASSPRLRLEPGQEHIRIAFALLDYADPQEHRYEYRVIGSNDQWTPIGNQSQLILQQVKPGDYVLELRATSATGAPAANPVSLPITALPHWYESLPAKLLYGVLAAIPFLLIAWFILRHMRTRTFLESERNNRRMLESMYHLSTELTEAVNETQLANRCLFHLRKLHAFAGGALFGFTNNDSRLLGSGGFDEDRTRVMERLSATHPRLLATVMHGPEPFLFSATDVFHDADLAMAGENWLGICAAARGGRLALLLASHEPWPETVVARVDAVFRQAVHALHLDMLREWKPSDRATDAESGLLSRQGLHAALEGALAGCDENFLCIFRFAAVDAMLARQLTWRLVAHLRESDLAARANGDTFVILLRNTASELAERTHRRILNSFADLQPAQRPAKSPFTSTLLKVSTRTDVFAAIDQQTAAGLSD